MRLFFVCRQRIEVIGRCLDFLHHFRRLFCIGRFRLDCIVDVYLPPELYRRLSILLGLILHLVLVFNGRYALLALESRLCNRLVKFCEGFLFSLREPGRFATRRLYHIGLPLGFCFKSGSFLITIFGFIVFLLFFLWTVDIVDGCCVLYHTVGVLHIVIFSSDSVTFDVSPRKVGVEILCGLLAVIQHFGLIGSEDANNKVTGGQDREV